MASSRKKSPPSDFDFDDFLHAGPESGMRTAVRAMLHRAPESDLRINLIPAPILTPTINTGPGSNLNQVAVLPFLGESAKELQDLELANSTPIPDINLNPGPEVIPGPALKRNFPIRQMRLAQDAHSRTEQSVYQRLWETAKPLDEVSRTITIGFGEMGRLVGLSESNARINTRSLIGKLAIEEYAGYDCEQSTGRTYRIFTYQEILNRRKQAGLTRYQRRTLAVVFVDEHDQPIALCRITRPGLKVEGVAGPKLTGEPGRKLDPGTGPNLEAKPGLKLGPLNREQCREQEPSSALAVVVHCVQAELGTVDDAAARQILESCYRQAPNATNEELEHFVRLTASRVRNMKRIENPIGFLISAVAKNFEGEAFRQFRKAEQQRREQGREVEIAAEARREELRAKLDDPRTSEEEKTLIRRIL
jgi:hypothetical protein